MFYEHKELSWCAYNMENVQVVSLLLVNVCEILKKYFYILEGLLPLKKNKQQNQSKTQNQQNNTKSTPCPTKKPSTIQQLLTQFPWFLLLSSSEQ